MAALRFERGQGNRSIYLQIGDMLRRDIRQHYKTGDALPSENALSKLYQVNRHTIRRAVDELVRDGIVVRQHGKGMFVQAPSIQYPIVARTRFTETIESHGLTSSSRVIGSCIEPAYGELVRSLAIAEASELVCLETVREMDGIPFCLCRHFLPHDKFQGLHNFYSGGSLHDLLEQKYGIELIRLKSTLTAVMPEAEDLALLNVPQHQPVLRVKSINVDKLSGKAMEYVITRFRGDLAEIIVEP